MIAEINERLQRWAAWATKREKYALGFPSQTIEAELVRMGGVLIRAPYGAPRGLPGDPEAGGNREELIERLSNG